MNNIKTYKSIRISLEFEYKKASKKQKIKGQET